MNLLRHRIFEYLGLLVILGLAAYLRLSNLSTNPGWYTDEATHINIAHNLLQGHVQYLAITQSTLLFARPPLFHLLLAGWFRILGDGMTTLRMFTGMLGMLSVGVLYVLVRKLQDDRALPLLASLLLAIYPQAVLYSRFGFSYNLLVPLILLALIGLGGYVETGRRTGLVCACLLIGFGLISEVMALTLIPALLLVILVKRPRDVLWAVPLTLVPLGLYTLVMLATASEAFLFDLRFTFIRLNPLTIWDQVKNLALNETTLLSQDFWTLAGVIGLFLLRPARLRNLILLFFWMPLLLVGRTVALYSLSAYYMIPLFPFIALGSATLLRYGVPIGAQSLSSEITPLLTRWKLSPKDALFVSRVTGYAVLIAVAGTPLLTSLTLTAEQVQTHIPTAIDAFLIRAEDAEQAANYINSQAEPADMVIASPAVGWQFKAQVADFQMSVAANGEDTPHLPGNIPPERWAFDPRLEAATWVVVDPLWRNWGAVHIPGVARMLANVESNWQKVFSSGAIEIYHRPG